MNTAITTTLISVMGAGLLGMFFVLFRSLFMMFKSLSETVANGFASVNSRIDSLLLDVHGLETKLTDKFTAELRAHGERLARIEAKLERDPPAEAA